VYLRGSSVGNQMLQSTDLRTIVLRKFIKTRFKIFFNVCVGSTSIYNKFFNYISTLETLKTRFFYKKNKNVNKRLFITTV